MINWKKNKNAIAIKSIFMGMILLLSITLLGAIGAMAEAEKSREEYLDGKLVVITGTIDENNPPPWDKAKKQWHNRHCSPVVPVLQCP